MATTLVKVYYLDAVQELVDKYPQVDISVYIDDFQLTANEPRDQVVQDLAEATVDLAITVERDI